MVTSRHAQEEEDEERNRVSFIIPRVFPQICEYPGQHNFFSPTTPISHALFSNCDLCLIPPSPPRRFKPQFQHYEMSPPNSFHHQPDFKVPTGLKKFLKPKFSGNNTGKAYPQKLIPKIPTRNTLELGKFNPTEKGTIISPVNIFLCNRYCKSEYCKTVYCCTTSLIRSLSGNYKRFFIKILQTGFKNQKEFIPIQLGYKRKDIFKTLQNLQINNRKNELIPVNQLVKIRANRQYKSLTADRKGEYILFDIQNLG